MPSENRTSDGLSRPPADQRVADAGDLVFAALDFLRGGLSRDGEASGPPTLARQESGILQWADGLGLLLNPADKTMAQLVAAGIARELTGQRRNRVFSYDAYLSILNEGGEPL